MSRSIDLITVGVRHISLDIPHNTIVTRYRYIHWQNILHPTSYIGLSVEANVECDEETRVSNDKKDETLTYFTCEPPQMSLCKHKVADTIDHYLIRQQWWPT
jgi:hypothetical protein